MNEICCDQLAIQFSGARSDDYGRVLVKATVKPRLRLGSGLAFAGMKTAGSKQTLINRIKALESLGLSRPKRSFLSFPALILFGLAAVLPWQPFPSVLFSVKLDYNNYEHIYDIYPQKMLLFAGNINTTANIYLKNFEVVIDGQSITDGIMYVNSYGRRSDKNFNGYLLVEDSFDLNKPHQVKLLVSTTAGDFQRNYVANFKNNPLWENR